VIQTDALLPMSLLLAACGGSAVMASADGRIRVIHVAEAHWKQEHGRKEMESALERHGGIDLVYAHNDPMACGAWDAARQKGRTGIKFVGVDALPGEGRKYVQDGVLDATIEYPTGGAEAVDLALLAANGIRDLPKDIVLGTRVWNRDNLAAGGMPIPAPGDVVMADLRRRHADVLTTTPVTDQIFKIGMAQCTTDEPWRVVMNEDIRRQAARYPQIELVLQSADDDTEKQRTLIRQFLERGCNAILVSPKESRALVAPCKEALQRDVPVIVLDRKLGSDDYTVFVGGDNLAIGRAAGREIARLLGGQGNVVELQGLMTSTPGQERHQGFVEALGLRSAR
jgi:ABC-type sugar transport system substrate-binding protein